MFNLEHYLILTVICNILGVNELCVVVEDGVKVIINMLNMNNK